MNFKIKICGITSVSDAVKSVELGADAIGLNFYSRSLRSVQQSQATEIAQSIPGEATQVVGVFVNESSQKILHIAKAVGLNAIQLHGDETPDIIDALKPFFVIRAIRCGNLDIKVVQQQVDAWISTGADAILLDSAPGNKKPDEYGGTGETIAWDWIPDLERNRPLILAGGLNPTNVATAIQTVVPDCIDTASGVEGFPGKKDHQLLEQFIVSAKEAFQKIGNSRETP